ncbi:MAG TPA: methylglutaconyl-CoA hydratase [Bacteroidetes bacterium]|nr:methylglutaconyl-CoA hydratase [Bacteroidota bacterium]
MDPLIIKESSQHVEFIFNRPEKKNALNADLVAALTKAFRKYGNSDQIRLIVLTGSGDVFSAGADLESLHKLQHATMEQNLSDSSNLADLFRVMYLCDKPILGVINGHALAGGCGLVSMCDISLSALPAKFGYTETRIGFVPAIVSKFLYHKIGEAHTRRLLLSGAVISSDEALRIGLISEITENIAERSAYWIQVFTKEVSPQAVTRTKKLLRNIPNLNIEVSLENAVKENASARMTNDCKKGISAFLNKEKIQW